MRTHKNLNVIRVAYRGHTNRRFFVEWNQRVYAFIKRSEMEDFADWMGGVRKTLIKLSDR
jgi:hypothetical protein